MKFYLLLWVIFSLLDPDPDPDSEYGSGSIDLIGSGSNPDPDTDPDPKPWKNGHEIHQKKEVACHCAHGWLLPGR